jgi:hypothetical protein
MDTPLILEAPTNSYQRIHTWMYSLLAAGILLINTKGRMYTESFRIAHAIPVWSWRYNEKNILASWNTRESCGWGCFPHHRLMLHHNSATAAWPYLPHFYIGMIYCLYVLHANCSLQPSYIFSTHVQERPQDDDEHMGSDVSDPCLTPLHLPESSCAICKASRRSSMLRQHSWLPISASTLTWILDHTSG